MLDPPNHPELVRSATATVVRFVLVLDDLILVSRLHIYSGLHGLTGPARGLQASLVDA
jgi:hypothetical protein